MAKGPMTDYETLSAPAIAAGIRKGFFSAWEVTRAALEYIERSEPRINAFVHLAPDVALANASALDAKRARGEDLGELGGVPISIKDLYHVVDMPTSFGSPIFAGQVAKQDSLPVARLRSANTVIIGKTTLPEFAHKSFTDAALFGITRNPWNPAYTSGGSSGGSAASVAAGQTRISLGSDGGGSIRTPVSTCGVFGIKGTMGIIPELAPNVFARNSYSGPIARTLAELRLGHDVLKGMHSDDPWSLANVRPAPTPPVSDLRVGFALTVGNSVVETDVENAFESARQAFARAGAQVTDVELNVMRYDLALRTHWETQLAARIAPLLDKHRDQIEPALLRKVERGLAHSALTYVEMMHTRAALFRDVQAIFEHVDIVVTPTLAAAGMPADGDFAEVFINGVSAGHSREGWHPYTWPFNLTGHPALSIPCGWARNNLPIGLQMIGRWYADDLLMDVAGEVGEVLGVEQRTCFRAVAPHAVSAPSHDNKPQDFGTR